MQGIKIRGMVLFEKFFDACCRISLLGKFERTEIYGLPGRSDKGAEHQAELFIWRVYA